MNIITVTLNPAYDVHYYLDRFVPFTENYARSVFTQAGGKGLNVSRALKRNGIDSLAYIFAGRENSENFIRDVRQSAIQAKYTLLDGRIRENITLHGDGAPETRISLDSFCVHEKELDKLEDELLAYCGADTVVVFSGRVPKGISERRLLQFLIKLRKGGLKLCVDSNSLTFKQLIQISPWLIKPNEQELSSFANAGSDAEMLAIAGSLVEKGIENVIITLGARGAVYANREFSCRVRTPAIKALSTIGAGDSVIAGFIAAYAGGDPPRTAIKTAAAFGTAACMTKGTAPPEADDIKKIYPLIELLE